jgi:hypothetical protein
MARDKPGAERSTKLSLEGIAAEVPPGWECRIRKAAPDQSGGRVLPVLHAATVPLPSGRADYGGGVVEHLTDADVFISLVEFGEEDVGSALFPERDSIPEVSSEMFHPFQLQRRIRGQAGVQVFFTYQDRAFCLYVVLGSNARRAALSALANQLIRDLSISSR